MGLLKKRSLDCPSYAIKSEHPDFLTFRNETQPYRPVEIVEVLEANRKRDLEYKTGNLEAELVDDSWAVFIDILRKKFSKSYGKDCWLLIYYDILITHHTNYGFWHNIMLANARLWYEPKNSNAFFLGDSPYEQIYVIDSGGEAAVKIYPELSVVGPNKTPNGFTIIMN